MRKSTLLSNLLRFTAKYPEISLIGFELSKQPKDSINLKLVSSVRIEKKRRQVG